MSTADTISVPISQLDPTSFQKLLDFLTKLNEQKCPYRLSCWRDEAIMVELATPGDRWEIEFFADGHVEIERFRSNGSIVDESALAELFAALI